MSQVAVPVPPGDPAALETWAGKLATCADAFESLAGEAGR
jgi:hypothetical protein